MKILVAGDFCPSYRINDFLQKNNFKGLSIGGIKL